MGTLDTYKVDHLFLLIGSNPLPNYVAARLLAKDPATTTLWLVHSKETILVRDTLERELKAEGFQHINAVLVDEASPTNIRNQVESTAKKLPVPGLIGLNYTGGTKAMSVHAYRALEQNTKPEIQYSYLDARTLKMQIQGYGISSTASVPVGHLLSLQVDQLLRLHSREFSLKRALFWSKTAQALMLIHTDKARADQWHAWLAMVFFTEPNWPTTHTDDGLLTEEDWKTWVREHFVAQEYKRRTWRKKGDRKDFKLALPEGFHEVYSAIKEDTEGLFIETLGDLLKSGAKCGEKFRDLEDLGKWLEGEWLETAVMQLIQTIRDQDSLLIDDLARDIQANNTLLKQQVQIDVAFTRGYRLFVVSCTTSDDKGICKSKLLEASIRAEQIGGAEACVCLVCCYQSADQLEKEVADVLGKRLRVFGRADLPNLRNSFAEWIEEMSYSQEA